MSFNCKRCGHVAEGTKMVKKVMEIRPVFYQKKDHRGITVSEAKGAETAKEITLCPDCALLVEHVAPSISDGPAKAVITKLPWQPRSAV